MVERERRHARPRGTVFVPRTQLLSSGDIDRILKRIAHEVVEHNPDTASLVIIGLQTGGVAFAQRLSELLTAICNKEVIFGVLDVAFYRDDLHLYPVVESLETSIPVDLSGMTVLLVDDVLYTGRTIRAALNALSDWGRAASIQLAVVVDRGHRELPIRPDYIGKNLPTSREEAIDAQLDGVWLGSLVRR